MTYGVLTIELPGAVMFSEKECKDNNLYDRKTMRVFDKTRKENQTLVIKTRQSKPAIQKLNISKEAFEAMIDIENVPHLMKMKEWSEMTREQRIDYSLKNIADNMGGKVKSFELV